MKKLFAAQEYQCEIELQGGDKADIVLRELTIPQTDEFFNLMVIAALRYYEMKGQPRQTIDQETADALEKPSDLMAVLMDIPGLWELVLGRKSAQDWIHLIRPSDLMQILECFIEINPLYQQKKSLFEKRLKALSVYPQTGM